MKLVKKECMFYQYNDEYGVEIIENTLSSGEDMWEAWLVEKDYGIKTSIMDVLKKDVPSVEAFLESILNDIDTTIELFEQDKLLFEADPDIVLNRPVNDMFNELFERTLNNCRFLEKENNEKRLLNEIGCLRGIMYAIEKVGESPINEDAIYFIDKARDIIGDE